MGGDFKDLKVYRMAYKAAMAIFELSKGFPQEEKYALVDQIRRSCRSVCANIAEGYRKRTYPRHFAMKMTDADAEASETMVWLDFAKDCDYIDSMTHETILHQYDEIGRMLGGMANNPEKFVPRKRQSQ
jgi:four helix bundle protein